MDSARNLAVLLYSGVSELGLLFLPGGHGLELASFSFKMSRSLLTPIKALNHCLGKALQGSREARHVPTPFLEMLGFSRKAPVVRPQGPAWYSQFSHILWHAFGEGTETPVAASHHRLHAGALLGAAWTQLAAALLIACGGPRQGEHPGREGLPGEQPGRASGQGQAAPRKASST